MHGSREVRVLNAIAEHERDLAAINRTEFVPYKHIEDPGLQAKVRREDDQRRLRAVLTARLRCEGVLRSAYPVDGAA